MKTFLLIFIMVIICGAHAKEIVTNNVNMSNAPEWLKQTRVEHVTDHIQGILEWTKYRIHVGWYPTQAEYAKVQNLGPLARAVTKNENNVSTVYLGPQVNDSNFDEVFGHELVHVIIYQKYRNAVPKWLEEGLANHYARKEKVNYKWLASQPYHEDVHNLGHPFSGSTNEIQYRYVASQAFAEMLAKKCDLEELLRLSVQRKMEDYMRTYCEIKDLNAAFTEWVKKNAT